METSLFVLIVEDVEDDVLLLLRELRRGGYKPIYEQVETSDAMRAALDRQVWDVVISDYSLPTFNAFTALRLLQERGVDIPFIIVSGTIGEETAVAAMRAGAQDYLMKGNLARLVPSIAREVREAAERRARRQTEQTLRESEERYRSVIEQASEGIFLFEPHTGHILEANPAFAKMLGYTASEVIELIVYDIVVSDSDDMNTNPLRGLTEGTMAASEQRYRRKDNSLINVEVSANRVRYGGSMVVCAVVRDITVRKRRERDLEVRTAVTTALRAAVSRRDMPPIILEQVMKLIEVDGAALVIFNAESSEIAIELTQGWIGDDAKNTITSNEINDQILATATPHVQTERPNDDPILVSSASSHTYTMAGVPLIADEQAIGVLWAFRKAPITDDEIHLMTAIGDIAARATLRATIYEQTRQRLQRLDALHTIQIAIGASLDLHTTLNVLLDNVITQLDVDAARVLLLNPAIQTLEYAAGRGFRSDEIERFRLRMGEGVAGHVALERRTIKIPNFAHSTNLFIQSQWPESEHFRAYYGVPLIAKGQVKGVLDIFHRVPLTVGQEWVDFLESLAAQAAVAIDNATLFDDLQRSNTALTMAYDTTLEGWSRALDLRDKETQGHTHRVTEMTIYLAQMIGIRNEELIHIRRGALLHDIGKMGIPDEILFKPGPLTNEEWAIMRKHPVYAYELLAPITFLRSALDIPYCHHEKWDGSGYPRGLKGEAIPLAARIFALVDVWDALCSDRPYRAGWPKERVRAHMQTLVGSHFDPKVATVFLKLTEKEYGSGC